jgi:hypothetical protein
MSDKSDNELRMTVTEGQGFNQRSIIEYMSEIIQYERDFDKGHIYTFSDGSIRITPLIQIIVDSIPLADTTTAIQKEEMKLIEELLNYFNHSISGSAFIGCTFFGLLLLILALGIFLYPASFWRFQHFLSVEGGEPTAFYIFMTKAAGIAIAAVPYGLLIVVFVN